MDTLYPTVEGHRNNFDFLRFVLATAVVFSHSFVVYTGDGARQPFMALSHQQLGLGTLAINFFFSISGFLISQSWERTARFSSFMQKRILRIYPGFIFVCLATAFVFSPLGRGLAASIPAYWSAINIKYLLYRTLTLREPILPETFKSLPYPNAVNDSLWSISYEFVCYLMVPLGAAIGVFRKSYRAAWLLAAVLALNLIDYDAYHSIGPKGLLGYRLAPAFFERAGERIMVFEHLLLPFIAGMCFYIYRRRIPRSGYLVALSCLVLVAATRWFPFFEIAQAIFGAYLLFYFVFSRRVHLHGFAKRGDFSYGIYLYSWPVQQVVMLYLGSRLNVYGYFLVSMALTLPLAAMSWYLIEKPLLRLKTRPAAVA